MFKEVHNRIVISVANNGMFVTRDLPGAMSRCVFAIVRMLITNAETFSSVPDREPLLQL